MDRSPEVDLDIESPDITGTKGDAENSSATNQTPRKRAAKSGKLNKILIFNKEN